MRYYMLSMLPILICPLLCLTSKRWMEAYFSIHYFILLVVYFLGIYLISKTIIEIKYLFVISILAVPFSFVTALFVIFYTADKFDITKLPGLFVFFEMITIHLILVAICGVIVKKFLLR